MRQTRPIRSILTVIAASALLAGCSAEFTDLRPPDGTESRTDAGDDTDAGSSAANNPDPTDAGVDTGDETDAAAADAANNGGDEEALIATGDFVNVDYQTSGSAQYWRLADGSYEIRLTADFSTQGVPGPALALSPRNPLGGAIDADELGLGGLDANSGAQSYPLPGPPDDYSYAWIWCEPFGLDVAFAQMEFQ